MTLKKGEEEDIIYGRTDNGKDNTLINTIRSLKLNTRSEFPIVRYTCDYMAIGSLVNGLDEKRNNWTTASIPELTLWCCPDALTTTIMFGKNKSAERINLSFSTEFRSRKEIINSVKINDNTAIKI